ncbi:MAG: elongation factor P, elongation factor P [Candidatus Peregrinibacteria bacterium GW2011_GWF2_33_10]|nr:MAG: elongation factor P, elongation factor P [Candidatus Peregrinibacteria bacterium GW2011_GWF2_33_10]OGJ45776.1 MAG: elongation factor P [Candidatus Peregrinibacteria bacterium RIFOXYA2_FULL_33_21]OGJ46836.1 MAG: elongation factor P [Candidatus Peregrinibacteria bacterium RIFOXYA12_FULL_33_12]OGJ51306.1 MAG: elongation factor P [Candidatus Peregrinibacteria bacterium RIFOXYB2_FULL_33_20]
MFYPLSQIQNKIIIDAGDPCLVTKFLFSKKSQGQAVAKCTLKNLKTGINIMKTFHGNDKIEAADIKFVKCQYLYENSGAYTFMNNETYEQFDLDQEMIGDQKYFLIEGTDIDIQMFEDRPISVCVPPKMNLKVIETQPGLKGDTASGTAYKPATVSTGLTINVPLFINENDLIKINTETLEYCERVQE